MAAYVQGALKWKMQRDEIGHRNYSIQWLVVTDDPADDPSVIFTCPGLPVTGTSWAFGNGTDVWARCHPDWAINQVLENEPNTLWTVDQIYSTRPIFRCQDASIDNPLAEPPVVGGSFSKYVKQASLNRDGLPNLNSSGQIIKGSDVERDFNRPTVQISVNMLLLDLSIIAPAIDTTNSTPMWGLDVDMVKLSNFSWQRKLYGTCSYYFTYNYDFEIDFDTWAKQIVDYGDVILLPGGNPNCVEDFDHNVGQATGNILNVLLDGAGKKLLCGADPVIVKHHLYGQSDLAALPGIPSSFT